MDANSQIPYRHSHPIAIGLPLELAPAAREVRATRATLLRCERLGWRFWGRKVVRHASWPLRAGVRTRAPTPWLPALTTGLRARGGTGARWRGRAPRREGGRNTLRPPSPIVMRLVPMLASVGALIDVAGL